MQSFDLFTIILDAILKCFSKALRGFVFIAIGVVLCIIVINVNSLLFDEFLPIVGGRLSKATLVAGLQEITELKYVFIFLVALLLITLGMITNMREAYLNFSFLSLMVAGALSTIYFGVAFGLELNASICWLLVILILGVYQATRQYQIVNTRRWEARLESIREYNMIRRQKQARLQREYLKQMEDLG